MDNKKDVNIPISTEYVDDVKHIIDQGREMAYITVNSTMIATYEYRATHRRRRATRPSKGRLWHRTH